MRCPKCHYISFDASERCRNCGYEFSFTVDVAPFDLPVKTGNEAEGPLADLSLADRDAPRSSSARPPVRKPATSGFDLPLFTHPNAGDDAPLVTPPAVPRPPLAVRKSTPPISRTPQRIRLEEPELDLRNTDPPAGAVETPEAFSAAGHETGSVVPAPHGRRLAAALLDVLILLAIDVAILYFTMRLCGLQLFEIGLLPFVPLAAFLLMQNGGYFVAFVAAGGQTIGKMAFGLKVIPRDADDAWTGRVPPPNALVRAVAWALAVAPAGLGLLPALLSEDRRALHDRLANTRVVKA